MTGVTTIPFRQWWSTRWRARPWNPNPLMRGSRRWESAALILAVLACLLSVPVAAALGTAAYSAEASAIRAERASVSVVDGLIVDEPRRVAGDERRATVRWGDGDPTRTAVVPVGRVRAKGDRLDVWLDADGVPTDAPRGPEAAPMTGIAVAVIVIAMTVGSGFLAVEGTRQWCRRRDARRWEREWLALDSVAHDRR
ncbi:Rv1733c family protein [Nocardia bovistercoris]|uniref:Transmembrane protein n=1 Tax=Nocardia bovistercoris TaxID=2785916 RepID=A0A931IB42_9NOCA|nr:hypothetical protein [Nocardia bovistercoris]MBH0777776.1 hypothetical protein [Nocardia bovistercoris]